MPATPYARDDQNELTTEQVLKRDINWEGFMTARMISDRDLQLIKRYDKRSRTMQESVLEESGAAYPEAFLSVLRNVTKDEIVQYVLALLDDMLTVDPRRANLFHQSSDVHLSTSAPDPYTIFLRLLQRTDWFTQEKACVLLTILLDCRPSKEPLAGAVQAGAFEASSSSSAVSAEGVEHTLVSFVDWLCSQLRRPSHPSRSVPVAVSALARLMKERSVRTLFQRVGGVLLLAPLLRVSPGAPPNQQLLYEASLCVWQLSFYQPAAEMMGGAGVVSGLVELARHGTKEKVVRMALLSLRSLAANPALDLAPDMIELGLLKVVQSRATQSWEDEDVTAALEWLEKTLQDNIQLLSSFDRYRKEVLSGSLDWTPMHTSEEFWRQNVEKFEERDYQILRVLLKLLEASREVRTLAVGASDVGKFITYHPTGRQIVTDLRGKELVMRLMMHPDPDVQRQSLLCVQKIMLGKDKLEFLSAA